MAEGGGGETADNSPTDNSDSDDNFHKFIVIGAGLSGLSAASHLAKNGFKDFKVGYLFLLIIQES